MPRLPNISKYWVVWRSSAPASSSVYRKLVPSIGSCSMPSTASGSGIPAASRIVGATSMTCVNCERVSVLGFIRAGHASTIGLRVPPRCAASCLPHRNGEFSACAQAAAQCGAVSGPPSAFRPP